MFPVNEKYRIILYGSLSGKCGKYSVKNMGNNQGGNSPIHLCLIELFHRRPSKKDNFLDFRLIGLGHHGVPSHLDGVPGKGIRLPFAQDRGAGDSVAIGSGTPHQQNPRDLLGGTGRQEPAAGGCGPRCNGATLGFPGLAFQEAVLVVRYQDQNGNDEFDLGQHASCGGSQGRPHL